MTERMTTQDAIEMSRQQGLATLNFFVIFSTAVDGWRPLFAHKEAHLAHQVALEREGSLFGAGGLFTEDGYWDGEGMIIVRASSMDEARQIADRDPLHKAGARTYRIRPWILSEGSISITVHLSDQKAQLR